MRLLSAALLTLLGLACFILAAANVYNIDRQPLVLLGGYALAGVAALWGAFRLGRSRSTGKSNPPAA